MLGMKPTPSLPLEQMRLAENWNGIPWRWLRAQVLTSDRESSTLDRAATQYESAPPAIRDHLTSVKADARAPPPLGTATAHGHKAAGLKPCRSRNFMLREGLRHCGRVLLPRTEKKDGSAAARDKQGSLIASE
jgi:hypothetical protein